MRGYRVLGLLTVLVLLLSLAPAALAQTSTPPPDQAPGVIVTGTPTVGAPGADQAPGIVVPSTGAGSTGTGQTGTGSTGTDQTGTGAGREATAQTGDGYVMRATEILGMRVSNMDGRRLGRIDNLLVAPSSGDVVYALVATGGFFGLGEKLVAVPFRLFRYDTTEDAFMLDMTTAAFGRAPSMTRYGSVDISDLTNNADMQGFWGEFTGSGAGSTGTGTGMTATGTPTPSMGTGSTGTGSTLTGTPTPVATTGATGSTGTGTGTGSTLTGTPTPLATTGATGSTGTGSTGAITSTDTITGTGAMTDTTTSGFGSTGTGSATTSDSNVIQVGSSLTGTMALDTKETLVRITELGAYTLLACPAGTVPSDTGSTDVGSTGTGAGSTMTGTPTPETGTGTGSTGTGTGAGTGTGSTGTGTGTTSSTPTPASSSGTGSTGTGTGTGTTSGTATPMSGAGTGSTGTGTGTGTGSTTTGTPTPEMGTGTGSTGTGVGSTDTMTGTTGAGSTIGRLAPLGTVEDVLVDLRMARITYVVVNVDESGVSLGSSTGSTDSGSTGTGTGNTLSATPTPVSGTGTGSTGTGTGTTLTGTATPVSGTGTGTTLAGTATPVSGTGTGTGATTGTATPVSGSGTGTGSTGTGIGSTDTMTGTGTGTGIGSADTMTGTTGADSTDTSMEETVGRLVVVPWNAMTLYADLANFCFTLDAQTLMDAPSTSGFEIPDTRSGGWNTDIDAFWSEQTSTTDTGAGSTTGTGTGSTGSTGTGAGIGSGSAITGTGTTTGTTGTTGASVTRGRGLATQSGMVMQAKRIMGTAVRNNADEQLGEVSNLLIASDSGQVLYAVLSYGGFLGFNANQVAIPWGAFRFNNGDNGFAIDIDMETLQSAPKLSDLGPNGISQPGWDSAVQEFWRGHGLNTGDTSGTGTGTGSTGTGSAGSSGTGTGTGSTGSGTGTGTGAGTSSTTTTRTGAQLLRADRIMGMTVRGMEQDATLGNVSDLLVNVDAGQVLYALLGSGGIFGIGESITAVPWDALTLSAGDNTLVLNMTADELQNAPQLSVDNLPETVDPNWDQNVRTWWQTRTSR